MLCPVVLQAQPHPAMPELGPRQKAELFLARGQFAEAVAIFKSLLAEGEAESALFRGLVRAYQGGGRTQEAENFLQGYLQTHPGSSPALYGLGFLHYLNKNDAEAEGYFRQAVASDPQNAFAWNNWGVLTTRTKSYTIAIEMVRKAISLDPENLMFYNNLSLVLKEKGESGLFFAEFEEYVLKGPRSLALGYGKTIARELRQKGFRSYSQGRLDESINHFKEMVGIYRKIDYIPGLVPGFFSLGLLFEEKGDQETARQYYRKVLELNPNHIQARDKLKGD